MCYFCYIKVKICVKQITINDMTRQEFIDRTGVEVAEVEFACINDMYYNVEVGKDEFCKLWMKMNPTRVARAKEVKAREEKKQAIRDRVWQMSLKYGGIIAGIRFGSIKKRTVGDHMCQKDIDYINNMFDMYVDADCSLVGLMEKVIIETQQLD